MASFDADAVALPPLDIKCTNTNCDDGQHCYLATKQMVRNKQVGACRDCGARPVNWDRVHARDLGDADHTFRMLRTEFIRHHFWHVDIDQKAVNHARRKGRRGMREAAERRIRQSVAAAAPVRDGRQTPFSDNALYYAQHATASCCRRCIEEWHAIPRGRALTEAEVQYLTSLVCRYVEERLPTLTEDGERVPVIRKPRPGRRATAVVARSGAAGAADPD
jgi:hypothetical protein